MIYPTILYYFEGLQENAAVLHMRNLLGWLRLGWLEIA